MVAVDYKIINAFTSRPDGGNPAAVVILPSQDASVPDSTSALKALYPSDTNLQDIAKELDKPMTAFVVPLGPGSDAGSTRSYGLRWFNPVSEAWLCGHATMAASALLFSQRKESKIVEYTTMKHGVIRAWWTNPDAGDKLEDVEIAMEFPEITAIEPFPTDSAKRDKILGLLESASVGTFSRKHVLETRDSPERVLLEVEAGFDLKGMKMDCQGLTQLSPLTIIFTQVSQNHQDEQIRSRVFVIVPGFAHEDMVTGSAHCLVVPYFLTDTKARQRLLAGTDDQLDTESSGNEVVRVRQVSSGEGRFTAAWMRAEGKVKITGRCVAVREGSIQ